MLFKKIVLLFLYKISFPRKSSSNNLLVLTYHRISDKPELEDPLKVSMDTFERQIFFLKQNYNIISAEQLLDLLKNGDPYPDNACLITFDDGWQDNYTHAYPMLKKYDVPALIFLSTDYIGTNQTFWHEQLKHLLENMSLNASLEMLKGFRHKWAGQTIEHMEGILKAIGRRRKLLINDFIIYLKNSASDKVDQLIDELRPLSNISDSGNSSMLSWEQVEEMSGNNISFGSHTKGHAILTQISKRQMVEELIGSKEIIEDKLSKPVYFLSYPNGYYNEEAVQIARDAGYLACFTCLAGRNTRNTNSLELKRKHISEEYSLGLNRRFSELFFRIELADTRDYFKRWRRIEKY
jgi:peptidoglycan/xylan/chitin deacetylase (PgdA/CDA1 family)